MRLRGIAIVLSCLILAGGCSGSPAAPGSAESASPVATPLMSIGTTATAPPGSTAHPTAGATDTAATHGPATAAPHPSGAGSLAPSSTAAGAAAVERFGVLELTFPWDERDGADPWEQVAAVVTFVAPSGKTVDIDGFRYGRGEWRARFSPDQVGRWSWRARLEDGQRSADFTGDFTVTESDRAGYVRSNPVNPMRWVFDDGTPYHPIGIGDCILGPEGASPLDNFGFDGEARTRDYPEGWRTDMETYLAAYGEAGFNLFRWSVDNCSFGLYERIDPAGNVYLEREGIYGDQLVQSLRKHGLRTYMVIFGFFPPFPNGSGNPDQMAAIRRYVEYVVARYAAYVDFWELMNESPNPPITIDDAYYVQLAGFVRAADPYRHPISTSWQRPDLAVIDINSPHWYQLESEYESDIALVAQLGHAGTGPGKPVIFGEQGNSEQNWDPRSALRMRIRSWTAFFQEVALIFWNTSCCKDSRSGTASNIYLGPEERGYVSVLQDFVAGLDPRLAVADIEVSDPTRVRASALSAPATFVAYLHAFTDHEDPTTGISVTVQLSAGGEAAWVDPATGKELGRVPVTAGRTTLDVPPFVTDVALKVVP